MVGPRIGGGPRRDFCHLGHPIEERYGRRRCWECYQENQRKHWHKPKNRDRDRIRFVFTTYGLPEEEYLRLLATQNGRCAICQGTCKTGQRLSVDHDHQTGQVRGLLCRNCNLGIGHLGDDPTRIQAALNYLEGGRVGA